MSLQEKYDLKNFVGEGKAKGFSTLEVLSAEDAWKLLPRVRDVLDLGKQDCTIITWPPCRYVLNIFSWKEVFLDAN